MNYSPNNPYPVTFSVGSAPNYYFGTELYGRMGQPIQEGTIRGRYLHPEYSAVYPSQPPHYVNPVRQSPSYFCTRYIKY